MRQLKEVWIGLQRAHGNKKNNKIRIQTFPSPTRLLKKSKFGNRRSVQKGLFRQSLYPAEIITILN